MAFFAAAFFLLRWQLPRLYGAEPEVARLCAQVLPIAAAFQLLDGTQVVSSGILRGLGRTKPAAVLNFVRLLPLRLAARVLARGPRRPRPGRHLVGPRRWACVCVAGGLLTLVLRKSTYRVERTRV